MSGTKSIPRETDRRRSGSRASVTFAALLAAAVASQARAARADYQSASYTFTQSNALADGVNYGTIQVESYYDAAGGTSNGLSSGQVRFTVAANVLASYGTLSNFGIDKFSFNTDLQPPPTNITVTDSNGKVISGWNVTLNRNISGFGTFDVTDSGGGQGGNRTSPTIFTVNNLGANATIAHFVFGSTGQMGGTPDQGSQYFVAHVAGFSAQPTSQYIGVSANNVAVAPEPATLLLGLAALVPLGVLKLRRRAGKS